jgi:glycine betaine/choline ABC-type transport system substrate-binding protein
MTLLLIVWAGALCSCGQGSVVIGHKDFSEQKILGDVVRHLLHARGTKASLRSCGDTYSCQRALRSGEIDVMVEYTGTGELYAGGAPASRSGQLQRVRRLYDPLGVRWLEPLGLSCRSCRRCV